MLEPKSNSTSATGIHSRRIAQFSNSSAQHAPTGSDAGCTKAVQPSLFDPQPELAPHYDGPVYDPARDQQRLAHQTERIKTLMMDGQWRTLAAIAEATGDPAASVSAQLRHLRKPRFGSYEVSRRHVGNGLYEYRVSERLEVAA